VKNDNHKSNKSGSHLDREGESVYNPAAAGRRRLLRAIGASGGVVAFAALTAPQWVKPVINAVLVPAHAQLSGCGDVVALIIETQDSSSCLATGITLEAALLSGTVTVTGRGGDTGGCKRFTVTLPHAPGTALASYFVVGGFNSDTAAPPPWTMTVSSTLQACCHQVTGERAFTLPLPGTTPGEYGAIDIGVDGSCSLVQID
jgi:hypothetical protein